MHQLHQLVLVRLRDTVDPESQERFTVKIYLSEKQAVAADETDGEWRQTKITLKSVNSEFADIVLTENADERMEVVAEWVKVVG